MCNHKINHGEQNDTLTFKVKGQGHSANVLKSCYLVNVLSKRVYFDIQTDIINHGEQNVTLIFKVKGQGHSANAQNHTLGHRKLILTCTYCMINQGKSNVNLIVKVTGQGHSEYVTEQNETPCSLRSNIKLIVQNRC